MNELTIPDELFYRCQYPIAFEDHAEQNLDTRVLSSLASTYAFRVRAEFNLNLHLPQDCTSIEEYDQCIRSPPKIPHYKKPNLNDKFPHGSVGSIIRQPADTSLLPLLIAAHRHGVDIREYDIISERNSFRKIANYRNSREDYVVGVKKLGSTLFLRRHDDRKVDMNDVGHRFERMCTPDYRLDASYRRLIEGHIGELRTLITAETDAVNNINRSAIELKCRLNPGIYDKNACWLQAFLGGADTVVVGHRSNCEPLQLKDIKSYSVDRLIDDKSKNEALERIYRILRFLLANVKEGDNYLFSRRHDQLKGKCGLYLYKVADQDKKQLTFISQQLLDQLVVNNTHSTRRGEERDLFYSVNENIMPERQSESDSAGEQHGENSFINNDDEIEDDEEDQDDNEPTPDFTDDDYGLDLGDDVLCPDLMAERPHEHESLGNIIVVDNLPKVDQVKLDKLKAAVSKVYSKFGVCRNQYYPSDAEGKTKGYAFFEFENEQVAQDAVKLTDGYRFDKSHTFAVSLMSDFDRLTQIPSESADIGNLLSWLSEPDAVDQFAVQSDDPKKTTIYANALSQPIVLEDRNKWTENNFVWSPKGTYLASFHEQGIAFWGGKEFRQVQRFTHRGVNYIDFSPNERYLVTLSPRPNNPEAFIVWDIITGQKKRSFPLEPHSYQGPSYFKWSFQDQYFAKQGPDGIYVYDTEIFQLVDKKPFRIPSVADFQWSPTDNRLAYWTAEDENVPARLVLAEINGIKLEEVRSKTLFNVIDCKLSWQKRGDYLVVKVDRYTKKSGEKNNPKYSGLIYNFEIFHMRERNVPLDTLEVKETIQSFALEPSGHKLVVITGESLRTNVTFYKMGQGQKSGKIELLKVMAQPVTTAIWAPNGQYVVLAAMKTSASSGGQLVFVDAGELTIMSKQEHPDLSDIEWDPTGRYVTSYVNLYNAKRDHSFKIWTFQGSPVFEKNVERLVAFHWRPRPSSLLTEEMIKEVRRNRAVWTQRFELRDRILRTGESAKQQDLRRKLLDAFQILKDKNAKRLVIQKQQRMQLRGGNDTDSLFEQQTSNVGEEIVEFLIKTDEVEYKP